MSVSGDNASGFRMVHCARFGQCNRMPLRLVEYKVALYFEFNMPLITEFLTNLKSRLIKTDSKSLQRKATDYHAVAVRPGLISCQQVQQWTRRRFLSKNAPTLPVPGCTLPKCNCSYKHYADRREEPRRLSDQFNMQVPWSGKNRRSNPGRRASDRLPRKK